MPNVPVSHCGTDTAAAEVSPQTGAENCLCGLLAQGGLLQAARDSGQRETVAACDIERNIDAFQLLMLLMHVKSVCIYFAVGCPKSRH